MKEVTIKLVIVEVAEPWLVELPRNGVLYVDCA